MTPGTSYTVSASNGSCSSTSSASFSIDAQLTVPSIPTITTAAATCLADGTASISNYDPTATYVFSPVGPTSGSTITGMTPGTSYTLTAGNGSCTSASSTLFSITAQLTVPSIPTVTTTAATCSANGTATITNYSGTLSYSFTPSGPTSGATISGMTPGTSYIVSASNGSCSSSASASFSIDAQLTVPSTPTVTTAAATCLADGTASISNYDPTATYTFSPVGPTAGATITGMTPGTSYTLTAGNGSCTSASSTLFSITAQLTQPSTPTITTTPASCSANGTATITNYSGTLSYTFTPSGPIAGSTITGMTPGTSYTVSASNGSCSSTSSASFSIDAQLTVPSTPTVTTAAATCLADGTASISNYDPTATYTFSPVGPTAGATITGMTPGTNYTLTAGNGSCTSSTITSFSIAAQLTQPSTPTITTIAATCSANGTATITNYSGTLFYTFTPSGPIAGSTITGMTPGTSYTVSASNGSCSSTSSASFSIDAQLATPIISLTSNDPSTCNLNDGSILVTGSGTGILNWSGSTNGSISSASLNYTITSLGAGNYDVYYVDGTTGCQSATLSTALINPGAPILNNPGSQTACDSFTLPTITGTTLSGNQAYYSNSQANGGTIISGPITSTQTVYIYDENGTCSDEESFVVTINNTPEIINPGPQSACVVYSLPTITGSNLSGSQAYYSNSQANGGAVISGSITSNQTVYIYDSNGSCSDEESFEVTINPEPTIVSFTGEATYCQGDVISDLIATVNGLPNYTLYYSINGIAQAPATSSSSNFNLGTNSGVYVLDSLSDLNCINNTLTSSQTITVNPIPVAPTAGTDTTYCSNATPVDLTALGNGTFTWYDNNNNILGTGATYTPTMNLGTTNYNVSQTENGCEGPVASVLIIVQECGIIISSAFTPDNDNANDVWLLENIDQIYPENVVTIYNRWGNVIYQSNPGQYELNPWDGTYNNEKMPVGSYYFIIEYNDNLTESSNGMITIIK
jgi:gliding motility-associated-like protein